MTERTDLLSRPHVDLQPQGAASTIAPGPLSGRQLRWLLTVLLFDERELSVTELVERIDRTGLLLHGRSSKVVSDALRWEIHRGRVVRRGRGRYGAGTMPRSTLHWRRKRVRALVAAAPRPSDAQGSAPTINHRPVR